MEGLLGSVILAKFLIGLGLLVILSRLCTVVLAERKPLEPPSQTLPLTRAEIDAAREELSPGTLRREWQAKQAAWVRDGVIAAPAVVKQKKDRSGWRPYGVRKGPMPLEPYRDACPLGDGQPLRRPAPETYQYWIEVMQRCRGELFNCAWTKAMATDGEKIIIYFDPRWIGQFNMILFFVNLQLGDEPFTLASGDPRDAPRNYIFSMPESQ